MADIEAQTDESTEALISTKNISIPRQSLEALVSMLARSAKILQQAIELEDLPERGEQESRGSAHERRVSGDSNPVSRASSPVGQLDQVDENVPGIDVVTEDERAVRKAANLKMFDGLIGKDNGSNELSVDSWNTLRYLPRRYFAYFYPLEDVPSGQQVLKPSVKYLVENTYMRQAYQKELHLGFSRWWLNNRRENSMQPVLDMHPLVALIGMRIQLHTFIEREQHPSENFPAGISRLRILLVLLELPHCLKRSDDYNEEREGKFWAKYLTVGHVLDQCYQEGVLRQPPGQDHILHRYNVTQLIRAIEMMTLIDRVDRFWSEYSIGTIRSMKISALCSAIRSKKHVPNSPNSPYDSFQSRELSLEILRKVVKLDIKWTEYLEEHLFLDVQESTLSIFWFGYSVKVNPIYHMHCETVDTPLCHIGFPKFCETLKELTRTYMLLFRSRRDSYKENIAEYGRLPIPYWLRVCYGDEKGTLSQDKAKDMSYFFQAKRPQTGDMRYHLKDLSNKLPPTQNFSSYKIWEDRLRQLKAYADSQKPGGIRGLWEDKRDSSQWFTFWAVITIGGAGVLLAFFGLIVSIVQTVGTFKGIG